MNCWHCERPAQGICRFCGRGLCQDHAQGMPYILAAFTSKNKVKAIAVADALYCGVCKPSEDPVEIMEIE